MIKKIDKRLLYFYGENCRLSLSKIAKKIHKSPQLIKYTVSRLEKNKIILFYYTVIDYSCFDMLLFKVYFKGGCSKSSELNLLVKKLMENPYVTSIYEMGGQYDFLVEFMAQNPSKFNKELKMLIKEHEELNNYDIIINIVSHLYPRDYLMPKNKKANEITIPSEIIVGGDRDKTILNDKEKRILLAFVENPKIRLTSIASKLDINIKTVISVIKSLKSKKIIRAYKSALNIEKCNLINNKITLKLHNIEPEKENKMLDFCLNNPNIVKFSKTIGEWDVEIDVETSSPIDFREIYLEIREEFKDVIRSFNSYRIYKVFKHNYLAENYSA
ncbi:MAG: Lrp/AsnC family transcriptional regulator [Nanoarchaeota archaeon]|nr:Lrp/AsnC family transcriptional regulator [Nanoarchaeota archaeon]MBU4493570.1 Lrp/AsnC family transcriptional regulator [Nanoarchaeota archaeon]MCG2711655.1 Lrp/AsnC family transcriptional regulator [Candidatus Omnitrophota bacterium]